MGQYKRTDAYWIELNEEHEFDLCIGCNYHLKWQDNKSMRFVLWDIIYKDGKPRAVMQTRRTNKRFTTDIEDLIFIPSKYNLEKRRTYKNER